MSIFDTIQQWFTDVRTVQIYGAMRSPLWVPCREAHLREFPRCAATGMGNDLEVHHIVPFHVDPSRELDPSNLITLTTRWKGRTNIHLVLGHCGNWRTYNPNIRRDAERFYEMIADAR